MSLNAGAHLNSLVSHAMTLGLFERVNAHEPKNAPGNGLTCAVWVDTVRPDPQGSGLAATSALVVYKLRIYTSMHSEPQDAIDPEVLNAVDVLWTSLIGSLTLEGSVRCIDVRGMAGVRMEAQAGYVKQADTEMRVMTITLPLLVNDVWAEAP